MNGKGIEERLYSTVSVLNNVHKEWKVVEDTFQNKVQAKQFQRELPNL